MVARDKNKNDQYLQIATRIFAVSVDVNLGLGNGCIHCPSSGPVPGFLLLISGEPGEGRNSCIPLWDLQQEWRHDILW